MGAARTAALLEGMGRIGCAAAGIGERDLALGYAEFVRRTAKASFPLLSTNVVRSDTKEPAFRPYAVIEAPRGSGKPPVKVGVMSVVRFNPLFLKSGPDGANLSIAPPVEMVRRYIDEVRGASDVVVLLAAMSRDDSKRLAREVPGIDLVAGAYGGALTAVEEAEGRTSIVYTQSQGRRVGETRFFLDDAKRIRSAESWMYFLGTRYPDDPDTAQFVRDALVGIAGAAGAAPATGPAAKGATGPGS